MSAGPQISAVVVGDSYETIEPLIHSLCAQEGCERIELVAVLPRATALDPGPEADRLGALVRVDVDDVVDLREARVAGFAAATAPIVLIAETHCFPGHGWLDAVLAAHAEGWGAVGPRMENANPESAVSWANFLDHYARFHVLGSRGPVDEIAGHNSTIDRQALNSLGEEAPLLLRDFKDLHHRLAEAGFELLFEPAAEMRHTNMSKVGGWLLEAWAAGRVGAGVRSRHWGLPRRVAYAMAWPLIAAVEIRRRRELLRRSRREVLLPRGAIGLLWLGIILRCAAEAVGFIAGSSRRAEARLDETEIRRLRYLNDRDRVAVVAELREAAASAARIQPATAVAADSQE